MDDTTSTPEPSRRGGKRKGAGRKPLHADGAMEHTSITVDDLTLRKLLVLGEDNISEGVRRAVAVAYDRFQRS
jgi:hypothetical protein